jgi:hypothetical protein
MAELIVAPSQAQRLDLERRAFLDLIRMANTMAQPAGIARQLVVVARYLSGCEAVAIRLKASPGYPYVASLGFPDQFLASDDDLCARDEAGHLQRDDQRKPLLSCLCGRVLTGQVDRALPCFTDRGSFIASCTSDLLASPVGIQLLGHPPNRSHINGYETLGLFPVRRDQVTYGLLQCNDRQPGRLTLESIDLMENLAVSAAHLFQLAMA